jgi:hypothetical protein
MNTPVGMTKVSDNYQWGTLSARQTLKSRTKVRFVIPTAVEGSAVPLSVAKKLA